MIRKLRGKFVFIMMSIVILILLIVFVTILVSTQNNLEQTSTQMLRQSLQEKPVDFPEVDKPGGGNAPHNLRAQTIRVIVLSTGEVQIDNDAIKEIGEEDILKAVQIALDSAEDTGTIAAYKLRYLKQTNENSTRLAFADTSMESYMIGNLVINSLVVGGIAVVAFLALSIFLAKWAVKPVEAAWQKQRQFIADASHELKTPLTVILSNTELLCEQPADTMDEKALKRLENIQSEGMRMKYLVEDMLVLARSDVMQQKRIQSEVCISDIIMDSVLLYESDIYDSGKNLDYQVEEDILLQADGQKLRQLIDILLDNAKKYAKEKANIKVDLHFDAAKKHACLSVASEGEAIAQEDLEHLFERFYRADKARTGQNGFGLGLAIAQSVVQEHGGKIWAESDAGENIFYVQIEKAYKKSM